MSSFRDEKLHKYVETPGGLWKVADHEEKRKLWPSTKDDTYMHKTEVENLSLPAQNRNTMLHQSSSETNIIIVELEGSKLPHFEEKGFKTLKANVQDILSQKWMNSSEFKAPMYFVSPANSLGFMDGGIDRAYMGMFKNIQQKVQGSIKELVPQFDNVTKLGRPYLPIGSAIKVPVEDGDFLISAPTMLLPQDVQNTKNAYWATKAVMKVWPKDGTLFLPMMCCGYGKMDSQEAAKQMKMAVDESEKLEEYHDYFINEPNMDEQPLYYENTEWKDISHENIKQKGTSEFSYDL